MNCSKNNIFVLPSLPENLIDLNCFYNKINNIPVLPIHLETLNISHNPIIGSISNINLPSTIVNFYCHNCQITDLPSNLPHNLKNFKCSENQISSLPTVLPNSLEKLNCSNNNLSVLPDLPNSLLELHCRHNKFDDESINKILGFYQRAINEGFQETTPSFEEELAYFQIPRSQTLINAFGQQPQHQPQSLQARNINKKVVTLKKKTIPNRSMLNISEYAGIPYPPPSKNKSNPKGGKTKKKNKKIRKSNKIKTKKSVKKPKI